VYSLQPPTPWLEMLTSPAVWAIIIANISYGWGFYTLLTCMPTYFKQALPSLEVNSHVSTRLMPPLLSDEAMYTLSNNHTTLKLHLPVCNPEWCVLGHSLHHPSHLGSIEWESCRFLESQIPSYCGGQEGIHFHR